jgi:hypothetical protein
MNDERRNADETNFVHRPAFIVHSRRRLSARRSTSQALEGRARRIEIKSFALAMSAFQPPLHCKLQTGNFEIFSFQFAFCNFHLPTKNPQAFKAQGFGSLCGNIEANPKAVSR